MKYTPINSLTAIESFRTLRWNNPGDRVSK